MNLGGTRKIYLRMRLTLRWNGDQRTFFKEECFMPHSACGGDDDAAKDQCGAVSAGRFAISLSG